MKSSKATNPRRVKKNQSRSAAKKVAKKKVSPSRPQYSEAFRRKVVQFSVKNGIVTAAEKFAVSTPSVTNWRKLYGVSRQTKVAAIEGRGVKIAKKPLPKSQRVSTGRKFSPTFRKEVAEFSISEGVARTADRFGVSTPSVTNWRREFGINRQSRQEWLKENSKNGVQRKGTPNRRELEALQKKLGILHEQVKGWLDQQS
jgi:transposase-like protein